MAEKNKEQHTTTEGVAHTLSSIELFFENNKKIITIVLTAIVVLVGGFFLYKRAYVAPLEKEAQEQMFMAERYFEKDSFNLALNGDGNNWGFLKIIDEYGVTSSANLAHYYAGLCYLHLGNYQAAIDQLKKFSSSDKLVKPIALGATGDAYAELGNYEKAIKYYYKAAKKGDNDFTAPIYLMKAAGICELQKNYKEALEIYQSIKKNYPRSNEARLIDKYITRVEFLLKKQ
ncbi:MAG: tetratricopeptide repeat protein [Bacteroidales bacterium]|nr:tetratricopeptide repeat protein [Bacteroidales bacterium]